jgi:sec-independent protein translocase protein TatC
MSKPTYDSLQKLVQVNELSRNKDDEMALSEHFEEFSQRLIFSIFALVLTTFICLADIRQIVKLFQAPALGVKFLQFAPGEYFFASLKIALFSGFLLTSPIILYQILLYVLPGLTKKERNILLPMTVTSGILFTFGLGFSYFFLVPAALRFFINYGAEVIEPFWSFDQYFNFVAVLIFITGIAFQVPIVQIILGRLKIVSGQQMLAAWKYVVVISTILSAIITPSTDPLTQILLATALFGLYLGGSGIVLFFERTTT